MKTTPATLIGSLLLLAATTPALAQCPHSESYVEPKSATEWESYLRGLGRLFEAGGEGFRDLAQGIKTIHEAREIQIRNRYAAVQASFDIKTMNREFRRQRRGAMPSTELLARIARKKAPQRLTLDELSPAGDLTWPDALLDARYARHRGALEWLMKARTSVAPERRIHVRKAIEQVCGWMLHDLARHINQLPCDAYIQAKNFARSLAYEARFDYRPDVASEAESD